MFDGNFIASHRNASYNFPAHTAMFISQWAHSWFVDNKITYKEYVTIQEKAYELFCPKTEEDFVWEQIQNLYT